MSTTTTLPARRRATPVGVVAMISSILSVQIGASFAKRLIDAVPGPLGATWLRLTSAAVIMVLIWGVRRLAARRGGFRPDAGPARAARPPHALIITLIFCAAMLTMNASIYEAIDRLPVGIAITIEFLGPLAVAIAASIRWGRRAAPAERTRGLVLDFALIACAGAGVALLGVRPASLNLAGVVFALVAASCWACYIVLGARVTQWFDTADLMTVMWIGAAVIFAVPALAPTGPGFLTWPVIALGAAVGLACSVVPTALELFVLRRLPPGLFAILESLAPAVAALAAWAILRQRLHPTDWAAIALVILASVGATLANTRRERAV